MLKQVIEAYELLDSAKVTGYDVCDILRERGLDNIEVKRVVGEKGSTDFLKIHITSLNGKTAGGSAPKGIIGRLGGIGARPERIGIVSDADGAITAIAVAIKFASMLDKGDVLKGDVIITAHICPNAPTKPHEPVPFMGSPVDMATMNKYGVDSKMDAILSIDTTKGNRIAKFKGFAITPTVKEGYILRVSNDLIDIMEIVTGRIPRVVPLTTQDITPYGNDLYHINSIMQPAVVSDSPIVGVAITTEMPVPGCATGASHLDDIEETARFVIEVAKSFGERKCRFYDIDEFNKIVKLYGSMKRLQASK